jgi:hypothetical protein
MEREAGYLGIEVLEVEPGFEAGLQRVRIEEDDLSSVPCLSEQSRFPKT